jgi:ABC-2 type transport system ATP-binding protein
MNNIIKVDNLVKEYKHFTLGELSFTLEKGSILGIVGPNGSGKTTLIKTILGMAIKKSGVVEVFHKDLDNHGVEIRDRIGFVNSEFAFNPGMKPKHLGKIYGHFYTEWDEKKYQDYLKKFDIRGGSNFNKLSTGMKVKASLAFALSHNAELLILDEPTAGLDPIFREEILNILMDEIEDSNKSIIISTHITSDLDKCADYLMVMKEGKNVLFGAKDDILDAHKIVKGDHTKLEATTEKLFVNIKNNKFGFEGLTKNTEDVTSILGSKFVVEKPKVEDIMVYYCKK